MSRKRREVVKYRAVDLKPGDVIQIRDQGHPYWVVVTSVYSWHDGATALRTLSKSVREGYTAKTVSNIGVALFIDEKSDSHDSRLDRIEAGLAVVVEVRRYLDRYKSGNWCGFDALSLVDVQEVAE